jgi:hypothetical protein
MTSPGERLERRLDRQLEQRPRSWFGIWTTLVLLGFCYRLALATRLGLLGLAVVAFAYGRTVVGVLVLVAFLAYLSQIPLIVDLARRPD